MRDKEKIQSALDRKRKRLESYYRREELMLSPKGIKSYSLNNRDITRYDTELRAIQSAIKTLEDEIEELELLSAGKSTRCSVGVILRDW